MRDDGRGAGTVIVAFVLGAITGAAVALLMAPASGDEMRRHPRREGARRPRDGERGGASGARVPEPPAREPQHGGRARPRGLRAGPERNRTDPRRATPRRTACEPERGVPRDHRARHAGDGGHPDRRHRWPSRRFARDAQKTLASVQEDVKPLIAKVSALADEATKTATIATAQAEKIDQLVTDLTRRIDETSAVVQQAVITPAREGLAIMAAIRAGLGALRGFRDMRARSGPPRRRRRSPLHRVDGRRNRDSFYARQNAPLRVRVRKSDSVNRVSTAPAASASQLHSRAACASVSLSPGISRNSASARRTAASNP